MEDESTPLNTGGGTTVSGTGGRGGRKRALFKQTVLYSLMSMKGQILKLTACWTLVAIFLLVGGYILIAIEQDYEDKMIKNHNKALEDLRVKLGISKKDMEEIQGVFRKHERCKEHDRAHWTGSGGAFFLMTTITTIGFGTFVPLTSGGRVFTILYGMLGIGLLGMTLSRGSVVMFHLLSACRKFTMLAFNLDRLDENDQFTKSERKNVTRTFDGRAQVGLLSAGDLKDVLQALNDDEEPSAATVDVVMSVSDPTNSGKIKKEAFLEAIRLWYTQSRQVDRPMLWTQLIVGGVLLVTTLCVGAAVFPEIEGWNYGDSFWFCWASLTTIGYGDFAPSTEKGQVAVILYCLLGLGVISYNVNCVSRIFLKKMAKAEMKINQRMKGFRDSHGSFNTTEFAMSLLSPKGSPKGEV